MEKLIFTAKDLARADQLKQAEQVDPLTPENLFKAGIYCVLSAAERYTKLQRLNQKMAEAGLDQPEILIANQSLLIEVLSTAHYPSRKVDRLLGLSTWWLETDVVEKMIVDLNGEKKLALSLRDQFVSGAWGIGYKTASLLMSMAGYEDVVPVDLWIIRYLNQTGHPIDIPDYETIGGLTKRPYLAAEQWIRNLAAEHGLTPAHFQRALWIKMRSNV